MAEMYRCTQLPKELFVNCKTRHVNFDRLAEWVDFQRERRSRRRKRDVVPIPKPETSGIPLKFSEPNSISDGDKSVLIRGLGFELLKHLAGCPGYSDYVDNIAAVVWESAEDEGETIKKCAQRTSEKLIDAGIMFWIHQVSSKFVLEAFDPKNDKIG